MKFHVLALCKLCQNFITVSGFICKETILYIKLNRGLPAKRLHKVSVQEVMISLDRRYVNGELGI